jgi:hypothetical protein
MVGGVHKSELGISQDGVILNNFRKFTSRNKVQISNALRRLQVAALLEGKMKK